MPLKKETETAIIESCLLNTSHEASYQKWVQVWDDVFSDLIWNHYSITIADKKNRFLWFLLSINIRNNVHLLTFRLELKTKKKS